MAFQTGTSSSLENLLTQLSTFAQANGWTEDGFTAEGANPGRMLLSKGGVFVTFIWSEAEGVIGIGGNTSNDDTADPWLSTGDDGQMYSQGDTFPQAIDTARCINESAGPHVAFWFFEQDSNPAYIHVVVEISTNRFRHFGFGNLEKVGDWAGGEYYYGTFWAQGAQADLPDSTQHAYLLDDRGSASQAFAATVRAPGLPFAVGAEQWVIVNTLATFPAGLDRAGEDRGRGMGSSRGGMTRAGNWIELSQLSAFKPLWPMPVFYADSSPVPDTIILLGTHPDARLVNMANIEPGEIITVAGEDWFCFPWSIKKFVPLDNLEQSWNGGTAYRRETA
jgi:hypothetical protein